MVLENGRRRKVKVTPELASSNLGIYRGADSLATIQSSSMHQPTAQEERHVF
jgi:hypothetical protein